MIEPRTKNRALVGLEEVLCGESSRQDEDE